MKRKLSLLLAMVLAMTMVMGISVMAFADTYDVWATIDIPTQVQSPIPSGVVATTYDCREGLHLAMAPTFGWGSKVNTEGSGIVNVNGEYYLDEHDADVDISKEYYYLVGIVINTDVDTISVNINGSSYTGYRNMYGYDDYYVYYALLDLGKVDDEGNIIPPGGSGSDPTPEKPLSPAHVHNFQWQTITEPTKDADGLEGEVCSCGATRNTQKLSAYGYALNQYATPMINAAKVGQTITFELGEWNSFPKSFMAKLVDKSAQNVNFVFHYKWNHVKQEITIPAGTPIDLNFDWYGPAKMAELYGAY